MKKALWSIVVFALVLAGCQKKEAVLESSSANFPTRQAMLSKIRKGMSSAEVKSALGPDFGISGAGGVGEGSRRASDGGLVLYFQNDQLVDIISSPKASGTTKEIKAKIRPGMGREEILSKVGFPDGSNYSSSGLGHFNYFLTDGALTVMFEQGRVKDVSERSGAKNDLFQ